VPKGAYCAGSSDRGSVGRSPSTQTPGTKTSARANRINGDDLRVGQSPAMITNDTDRGSGDQRAELLPSEISPETDQADAAKCSTRLRIAVRSKS